MPRPFNPDLIRPWKIAIPATLAGRVEFALMDRITGKPIYGARNKLISALLTRWLAEQAGAAEVPQVPSLEELRLS
jgi:hypothetical protein